MAADRRRRTQHRGACGRFHPPHGGTRHPAHSIAPPHLSIVKPSSRDERAPTTHSSLFSGQGVLCRPKVIARQALSGAPGRRLRMPWPAGSADDNAVSPARNVESSPWMKPRSQIWLTPNPARLTLRRMSGPASKVPWLQHARASLEHPFGPRMLFMTGPLGELEVLSNPRDIRPSTTSWSGACTTC